MYLNVSLTFLQRVMVTLQNVKFLKSLILGQKCWTNAKVALCDWQLPSSSSFTYYI